MRNLFAFLTDLATNPKQQEVFAKEPKAVMNAVGLSEAEQAMLKRGNHVQISAAVADMSFQFACLFSDPNPDPWPDPDPPPPDDTDSSEEDS